jgi:hypothetical protein
MVREGHTEELKIYFIFILIIMILVFKKKKEEVFRKKDKKLVKCNFDKRWYFDTSKCHI